jgi:FtsZ family, C-terminal domain
MGTAIIGAGEAEGERRAHRAAEAAIADPLFDDCALPTSITLWSDRSGPNRICASARAAGRRPIARGSRREIRTRRVAAPALAAMTAWVLAGARTQAVVLAFEDLHWADPTSLDLMRVLAERGTRKWRTRQREAGSGRDRRTTEIAGVLRQCAGRGAWLRRAGNNRCVCKSERIRVERKAPPRSLSRRGWTLG